MVKVLFFILFTLPTFGQTLHTTLQSKLDTAVYVSRDGTCTSDSPNKIHRMEVIRELGDSTNIVNFSDNYNILMDGDTVLARLRNTTSKYGFRWHTRVWKCKDCDYTWEQHNNHLEEQ